MTEIYEPPSFFLVAWFYITKHLSCKIFGTQYLFFHLLDHEALALAAAFKTLM